jgi:hypothetical protein
MWKVRGFTLALPERICAQHKGVMQGREGVNNLQKARHIISGWPLKVLK